MTKIQAVILSGGSGTRLWPVSRSSYPKQLLPLVGTRSMLQETAMRLDGVRDLADDVLIVCNEAHRFLVAGQMDAIGTGATIVLEPEGRNTAPATALAALLVERDSDADSYLMLVMPADHIINNPTAFRSALVTARTAAEAGKLVTFGITPSGPETGYGYIQVEHGDAVPAPVRAFVEKPDLKTAREYVGSGDYFWNSGIFLFSVESYLAELKEHAPKILDACNASIAQSTPDGIFIRPDKAAFCGSPSDSIDYAIMEKTRSAVVVPLDAGWSDVGSWSALHAASTSDDDGNCAVGDVMLHDCRNSYVSAEDSLVAAVGLDGVIVVETKDSVLVTNKDRSQDVKAIVDRLNSEDRDEAKSHRQVFRPWGSYDSIDSGNGFQVKRLIVNPGAILSLQSHKHRAEHWVVVQGVARITLDDKEFDLAVNESTFVPVGAVHRIANPFDEPAHIIEVQCGDYLGEDDIVRYEDQYGREGTNT